LTAALLDNDVLYKASRYGLIGDLLECIPLGIDDYLMLAVARFIVRKKLTRQPPSRGAAVAIAQFDAESAGLHKIEPSSEEIRYSAALELLAQQLNLPLDPGESLLCAVLTLRDYAYLVTGDKRAIGAIGVLYTKRTDLKVSNRLVCLEQLTCWLMDHVGVVRLRAAICAEPDTDKTLAICFSCHVPEASAGDCRSGLISYIAELRREAPKVLTKVP